MSRGHLTTLSIISCGAIILLALLLLKMASGQLEPSKVSIIAAGIIVAAIVGLIPV